MFLNINMEMLFGNCGLQNDSHFVQAWMCLNEARIW